MEGVPDDLHRSLEESIPVRFTRAPEFRFYHADGVFGGISPSGNIEIDFYVERGAFPDIIFYERTKDGNLGNEVERRGEKVIIRDRVCGVVMNAAVAISLRDWLTDKINKAEELGLFEKKSSQAEPADPSEQTEAADE